MSDARQSVEAAESIGAEEHAPVALNSAQQLLSKAQDDLQAGEYEEAQKEALAAREAARQAVAISQAKQASKEENDDVTDNIIATDVHPDSVIKATAPPLPTEPKPSFYSVTKNDNLWNIAAKESVYGDPLLWPLILKSNANLIQNADLIFPGQTLTIEPSLKEVDKDAAREHAKQRGKMTDLDTSYLHQYGLR